MNKCDECDGKGGWGRRLMCDDDDWEYESQCDRCRGSGIVDEASE